MTMTLYSLCGADPARPFSPHVWKVVMALHHKGLPFEERPTRFTDIPHIEGGATKTVPVLRDDSRLVIDSFAIAEYLDEAYPDLPSLFGGEGGRAAARFIESWALTQLHSIVPRIVICDIWGTLDEKDQAYFRASREARLGKPLEEVAAGREQTVELFRERLEPMRMMLGKQPFIGGDSPLFGDYILFGTLQWIKVTSTLWPLLPEDPVSAWFERCLALHDGVAKQVPPRVSLAG